MLSYRTRAGEYYNEGRSEKHIRDILGVLKLRGDQVNREYVSNFLMMTSSGDDSQISKSVPPGTRARRPKRDWLNSLSAGTMTSIFNPDAGCKMLNCKHPPIASTAHPQRNRTKQRIYLIQTQRRNDIDVVGQPRFAVDCGSNRSRDEILDGEALEFGCEFPQKVRLLHAKVSLRRCG